MKKILIIGAGAMGSAFTVPCVDNNNEVTLVGTHIENELIRSIKKNKNYHPSLKTSLSSKLNVERCNILAPYNGKVMDVYTNVFTSIEQRQPLMDIVGDGLLEAAVVVPSKWLKWLKKGHPVKIIIDETGEVLDAKVISLGAAVDAVSQTIELKAQFNEKYESLIPGMSGIVKF